MGKILSIAVLIVFILVAVIPVSARVVSQGDTVYINEQGLDFTHALNQAQGLTGIALDSVPTNTSIGWWASAAVITSVYPDKKVDLNGHYNSFTLTPSEFEGYKGNWYLVDSKGWSAGVTPRLVVYVDYPDSYIPVSSFTATPTSGPAPLTVQFTDTSSNNPTKWSWDFNDGTTANTQNPSHLYHISGVYTVKMTASQFKTDPNSATTTITVFSPIAPTTTTPSTTPSTQITTITTTAAPNTTITTGATTIPTTGVTTVQTTAPMVTTSTTPIPSPTTKATVKVTVTKATPWATNTPTQSTPLGIEIGIIATIGAVLLVMKRK